MKGSIHTQKGAATLVDISSLQPCSPQSHCWGTSSPQSLLLIHTFNHECQCHGLKGLHS